MVSIHSDDEMAFAASLFPETDFWIGLLKSNKEGQRHWSDKSSYNYDNWEKGGRIPYFYIICFI